MKGGRIKAVVVATSVAGLLAVGVPTVQAAEAAQPRPCMHQHTVGGVKYDTFCGPASVTFHVGKRAYHIAGGYCYTDQNGQFHVSVGSIDADRLVAANVNKTLRLLYFGLDTASRRVGNTFAQADVFYVLPGDHPPGEGVDGAKLTLSGSHGSLKAPYSDPAFSATFRC